MATVQTTKRSQLPVSYPMKITPGDDFFGPIFRHQTVSAPITSGVTTVGAKYRIASQSVVDFTAIGAANNLVGTVFVATGVVTLTPSDSLGLVTPIDTSGWTVTGQMYASQACAALPVGDPFTMAMQPGPDFGYQPQLTAAQTAALPCADYWYRLPTEDAGITTTYYGGPVPVSEGGV